MSDIEINTFIDSLRFRSFKKIKSKVKQRFPGVTDAKIRDILKKRIHDKKLKRERKRIYYVKVFSPFLGSWMCDIFDNGRSPLRLGDGALRPEEGVSLPGPEVHASHPKPNSASGDPRYWYIFINVNTRFAVSYPMNDKTKESINTVLRLFVDKYKPRKLTSDEESGLVAKVNLEFLKSKKCGLYIITEKNHTALSLIDRFIRTLRDMNTPGNESPDSSTGVAQEPEVPDDKYKHISRQVMIELLDIYNDTIHTSTGYKPIDMMNDSKLEEEYIIKCLDKKHRQQGIEDFNLKVGQLVRYFIVKSSAPGSLTHEPGMTKKRYSLSRETYKIETRAGNIYTIIALDGTTRDLPRWKLVVVDPNEKYVLGKTLGSDKGIVEKILNEVSPNKVNVKFKMPDGSTYTKIINKRELRNPTPQFKSKLEIGFGT